MTRCTPQACCRNATKQPANPSAPTYRFRQPDALAGKPCSRRRKLVARKKQRRNMLTLIYRGCSPLTIAFYKLALTRPSPCPRNRPAISDCDCGFSNGRHCDHCLSCKRCCKANGTTCNSHLVLTRPIYWPRYMTAPAGDDGMQLSPFFHARWAKLSSKTKNPASWSCLIIWRRPHLLRHSAATPLRRQRMHLATIPSSANASVTVVMLT